MVSLTTTPGTLPAVSRPVSGIRRRRSSGSQILEFTFVFLPLLAFTTVLLDTAWAVMAKATIQRAVRMAVRTGITMTASQMTGSACLTDTVKSTVQSYSLGLLNGSTGLSYIKVNYYAPPVSNTAAVTDVSTCTATGNSCPTIADVSGNIMQVSVQGLVVTPLMPRIFGFKMANDNNPMLISVYSADVIEPHNNPPCVGTAP
ncbi:MAG: TadE/TadG family type IV pilus assembly protein [Bryobacteraceae bacterium]